MKLSEASIVVRIGLLLASLCLLASNVASGQTAQQRRYLGLAETTARRPITPAELQTAVLSGTGIARIAALFERSVEEGLLLEGRLVTPELGGELLLDEGILDFVVYPDPVHDVVRDMVRLETRPRELLESLQSSPRGRVVLASTGGLHALLYMMTENEPPSESQIALLDEVIRGAVSTQFKTWTVEPEMQAQMIEATRWHGRYVGFWHLHPPRLAGNGFAEGIEPSLADMTNASEMGQFVTIVFQPDGFDFYDLSRLSGGRPDLSRARVYRHRSENWRKRFLERASSRN